MVGVLKIIGSVLGTVGDIFEAYTRKDHNCSDLFGSVYTTAGMVSQSILVSFRADGIISMHYTLIFLIPAGGAVLFGMAVLVAGCCGYVLSVNLPRMGVAVYLKKEESPKNGNRIVPIDGFFQRKFWTNQYNISQGKLLQNMVLLISKRTSKTQSNGRQQMRRQNIFQRFKSKISPPKLPPPPCPPLQARASLHNAPLHPQRFPTNMRTLRLTSIILKNLNENERVQDSQHGLKVEDQSSNTKYHLKVN